MKLKNLLLIQMIFLSFGLFSQGFLDSLNITTKNSNEEIATAYFNYTNSLNFTNTSLQIQVAQEYALYSKENGLQEHLAKAYNLSGNGFQFSNNHDTAIVLHHKAIALTLNTKFKNELTTSYKYLGNAYYRLGDPDSTIHYYQRAIEIANTLKDKKQLASLLHNISIIYKRTLMHEKSKKAILKSISINKELNDSNKLLNGYMSYGNLLWEQDYKLVDSVEYFYKKALSYINPTTSARYKLSLYDNFSLLYQKLVDPKLSLKYSKMCDPFMVNIQDYRIKARYFHQKSWAMDLLKMPRAKEFMDSGYYYANLSGSILDIGEAAEGLFKYHYFHQNLDSGDFYFEAFIDSRDSVYSLQSFQAVADAEEEFETEKITLKNENLKTQLDKEQLEKNRLWLVIGAIALFLLVMFLLYLTKINRAKIEKDRREIAFQEELVASNLKSQEEERTKIARELHDGLNQQIAGVKLGLENLSSSINEGFENQLKKITSLKDIVTNVSEEVRGISHQLVPNALLKIGLIDAVKDMVAFYNENQEIDFEFFTTIESLIIDQTKETHVYRIIQELTTNIIKHSQATNAEIQLHRKDTKLVLVVSDNGIGINDNSTNGIGLENIKSRVRILEGEIKFENEIKGTLIRVTVPI